MARLRLSAAARSDLANIHRYSVQEFGREVADTYLRGFKTVFALLEEHPLSGEEQPDLGANLRCFTHRRHRIFSRGGDDTILIVRVLHHRQDAFRALEGTSP